MHYGIALRMVKKKQGIRFLMNTQKGYKKNLTQNGIKKSVRGYS